MKQLAKRKPGFEIGRYCHVCGRGALPRLGGCMGARSILLTAGYEIPRNIDADGIDRGLIMVFAHPKCAARALQEGKKK